MNRYFPTEYMLVIAVVLMLSARIAAQPSAVLLLQYPLVDHPVYSYLERMQTNGSISLLSSTRPYLGHVHHSVFFGENVRLTREDRRYTSEGTAAVRILGYDIKRNRISGWTKLRRRAGLEENQAQWFYRGGFHFAAWQYDTTLAVAIQPVYGLEVIETDDERGTISRFTAGARVEGGYARHLHFMVDFRDHTETGNGPYVSRGQLYEDRWAAVDLKGGNSTSYNISESFLQYYGRDLSLTAGRGRFRWGPARHGSLFLNAQMPPFDYVRFDAVLENQKSQAIYYTFLHGWLQSQIPAETLYVNPGGRPRTLAAQKYFSAQRLEVRPRADLLFGFSQGVIYGDRGVQLGYLTPFNFLYSVQHSNDDKDNTVIGFDANWRPAAGVRLYGEAFFDDIVVSALTTSSGSNKSVYTTGIHLAGVQGFLKNFDGGIEYTKIRPFVYSHIFTVNTHTHWTSPLGYTLEPNSEFLTADVQGTFYPVQIGLHFSRQNHGKNTAEQNVGGSIYEPLFDSSENNLYPFLDGSLVRTTRMGVSAEWETLPNLRLRAGATHVKTTGQSDRFEWRGGFGWNLLKNYPPTTLIVGPSLELLEAARILGRCGEQIALLARSDVRLEQLRTQFTGEGLSCETFRADVTDPGEALSALTSLSKWSPRLDRLIYNRRVVSSEQSVQVPESEMNRIMGVNLFGFVNCFQLVHPMFKRLGGGTAIIVSDNRLRGPEETGVAYEASHAALQIYLAALRREVAPDHVHICELVIGIIREHDVLRDPNDAEVVTAIGHVIDHQPDRFSVGEPNPSRTGLS